MHGTRPTNDKAVKTLVLGLGNTILADDGAGVLAARRIRESLPDDAANVVEAELSGLNLLEAIVGYGRLIIVDTIRTSGGIPGEIHRFTLDDFRDTVRTAGVHDANLATTIELGRSLGLEMPSTVNIYAIEVEDNTTFREGCCPAVNAAVQALAARIVRELS